MMRPLHTEVNKMRTVCSFILFLLVPAVFSRAASTTVAARETGLSVEVDAKSGDYRLTSKVADWKFGGSFQMPLKKIAARPGRGNLGASEQLSFVWRAC